MFCLLYAIYIIQIIYRVPKNIRLMTIRKVWVTFSKPFFSRKNKPISISFKKEISILSHTTKKLQARQYLQNFL